MVQAYSTLAISILCTSVLTVALFTIAMIWQQSCPSSDKFMNEMWCIYTMGDISFKQKTSMLSQGGWWEHNAKQSQSGNKDKYHMTLLTNGPRRLVIYIEHEQMEDATDYEEKADGGRVQDFNQKGE